MTKTRPFVVSAKKVIAQSLDIIYIYARGDYGAKTFFKEIILSNEEQVMTLQDCYKLAKQEIKNVSIIKVLVEEPTTGRIYTWGNYCDKKWYEVGETCGYC